MRLVFLSTIFVLAASWLPAQQLPPDVACRGCAAGAPRGFATLARVPVNQPSRSLNPYDRPPELRLILPSSPAGDRWAAAGAARIVAARHLEPRESLQRVARRAARDLEKTRRNSHPQWEPSEDR
jgi:hypothetical protein